MKRRPCACVWFGQEMWCEVKRGRRGYVHAWPGRRYGQRIYSGRRRATQRLRHNVIHARWVIQELLNPIHAEVAAESLMKKIKAD